MPPQPAAALMLLLPERDLPPSQAQVQLGWVAGLVSKVGVSVALLVFLALLIKWLIVNNGGDIDKINQVRQGARMLTRLCTHSWAAPAPVGVRCPAAGPAARHYHAWHVPIVWHQVHYGLLEVRQGPRNTGDAATQRMLPPPHTHTHNNYHQRHAICSASCVGLLWQLLCNSPDG